ncbi:MAG: hypothetical protein BGP04_10440 [Rhizobiales bacterium 62-17]|nr:hypothetical protein [Hyphomicrobiales bacterium]OJY05751.1 MAG: hypothetical protein BGP04_10440 [Rhizobiales bacterium 62-17]
MQDWFRRLVGRAAVDPATLREQQNDWIKQKFKDWQVDWHDAFDGDPSLAKFERPDPLPDEIQSDHRLIFGLSRAKAETWRRCFALFPNGSEMQRRFETYLTSATPSLSESEARDLVAEIARHIDRANPNEQVNWARINVVDRNAPDARQALARADRVSILFDRNLLQPVPAKELPAVAAQLFLTEPLYASAGNYYELRDWVTAAMFDADRDKVYELVYRLWRAGWQPLVAEDGVVLAHDRRR